MACRPLAARCGRAHPSKRAMEQTRPSVSGLAAHRVLSRRARWPPGPLLRPAARLRRTNGPAPGRRRIQRAAATISSTLAAGATPRQAGPAAGHELPSRAHELSSKGVELLPKAGQPQPSPRAGARRAPCGPGRPRDGPTLSRRRRGAAARAARATPPARHRCGASAAREQARRGRGPAARRQTRRTVDHRRGGASDQSVIHMRRPTAGREAAECRGALTAAAPSLRSPPAAPLAGEGCGLLAQEPAQGRRRVQAA